MKNEWVRAIAVTFLATGLVTLAAPHAASAQDVAAQIEKIRLATMKYNDINVALAEGYVPAPPGDCVDAAHEGLPAHWGAMGIHYIDPKKLKITQGQPRVDGKATHTDFMSPSILKPFIKLNLSYSLHNSNARLLENLPPETDFRTESI